MEEPTRPLLLTGSLLDLSNCVYALADPCTQEIRYVGKTLKPVRIRFREHLRSSNKTHVSYWINSLPIPPIVFLLEHNPTDLSVAERYWVLTLRGLGFRLTNMTDGGDGTVGYHFSEETKAKMSASLKGKSHSQTPETRARISASKLGIPIHTPSSKAKLRDIHLGKVLSPEHAQKLAATLPGNTRRRGKKDSPETYARRSIANKAAWVRRKAAANV